MESPGVILGKLDGFVNIQSPASNVSGIQNVDMWKRSIDGWHPACTSRGRSGKHVSDARDPAGQDFLLAQGGMNAAQRMPRLGFKQLVGLAEARVIGAHVARKVYERAATEYLAINEAG